MKRFLTAILLLIGSVAFAENTQVQITPAQSSHDGYLFTVAAIPIDHASSLPTVHRVVVAITPPAKRVSPKDASIVILEGNDFLFSTVTSSCEVKNIPFEFEFRHLIPTHDTILFQFSIIPKYIADSIFSYQIPRKDEASEPVDCIINLRDFIKGDMSSKGDDFAISNPEHIKDWENLRKKLTSAGIHNIEIPSERGTSHLWIAMKDFDRAKREALSFIIQNRLTLRIRSQPPSSIYEVWESGKKISDESYIVEQK